MAFASAIAGSDRAALDLARGELRERTGALGVVTASLIAANFSMLDRAANAIGITVESMMLRPSADFRAELGINDYRSAVNTLG